MSSLHLLYNILYPLQTIEVFSFVALHNRLEIIFIFWRQFIFRNSCILYVILVIRNTLRHYLQMTKLSSILLYSMSLTFVMITSELMTFEFVARDHLNLISTGNDSLRMEHTVTGDTAQLKLVLLTPGGERYVADGFSCLRDTPTPRYAHSATRP